MRPYLIVCMMTQKGDPYTKVFSTLRDDDDDDVQWCNVHLKADWKPA